MRLVPDPFSVNHSLYLDRMPDVAAMNEAGASIIGSFDFTSFSKVKGGENHYVCVCYEAGWHSTPGGLVFRIRANRFVRGMVRLVVGTLLMVGRGKITPAEFKAILLAQSRVDAGSAAPAQGLFLSRVEYPPELIPEPAATLELPHFVS